MIVTDPKAHVDAILASTAARRWREGVASDARLLERLDELIASATDQGKASAVYWHGWATWAQALEMRSHLAQHIRPITLETK
jgi:hypothetical protein